VRRGDSIKAEAEEMRLATGAVVRQLQTIGDRLKYKLVSGTGPATGWVSLRVGSKDLLERKRASEFQAPIGPAAFVSRSSFSSSSQVPGDARKLKVLALHGGGVNANIMEYQTMMLRKHFNEKHKPGADWQFLNGPRVWKDQESATELIRQLARGDCLRGWYGVTIQNDDDRLYIEKLMDPKVNFTYEEVEKAVEYVMDHIKKNGPFDILVGFSQGCIMTHLVAGLLRERGEELPWRVAVQFCGMRVRDSKYERLFEQPLDTPCIQIYGKEDPYYEYGLESQRAMYKDPQIFMHSEGHKFPGSQDAEVSRSIAAAALKFCLEEPPMDEASPATS